jgi:hypothetical protein
MAWSRWRLRRERRSPSRCVATPLTLYAGHSVGRAQSSDPRPSSSSTSAERSGSRTSSTSEIDAVPSMRGFLLEGLRRAGAHTDVPIWRAWRLSSPTFCARVRCTQIERRSAARARSSGAFVGTRSRTRAPSNGTSGARLTAAPVRSGTRVLGNACDRRATPSRRSGALQVGAIPDGSRARPSPGPKRSENGTFRVVSGAVAAVRAVARGSHARATGRHLREGARRRVARVDEVAPH